MNMRIILFICSSLLLSSCVQSPTFKADDHAVITSNYPIVSVNDVELLEETYKLDIEAGENTLVIVYHTYQHDYHCTFSWTAVAGTAYEVTDQENKYPLTLYRWIRRNSLWAVRLNPVDPMECTIVSEDGDAQPTPQ
jgi:hypothetical protein